MRVKAIERQIMKIYKAVFNKIFSKNRLTAAAKGEKSKIEVAAKRLEKSKDYIKFCEEFSKKLSKQGIRYHKGLWKKYYTAAKSSHYVAIPSTYKEFEEVIMSKAIEHNFRLIKSIPKYVIEVYRQKYTEALIEQVANGSIGRQSFIKQLQKHSHKNAGVIARTETAKLQTAIDEYRATSLGSIAYEWLSSKDKRTRQSHRAMNGVIVFWRKDDEKPLLDKMRGNAGEFPNCRCSPLPILDDDDLKKSYYNVYDYRYDKIITLSKSELKKALQNGKL